MISKISFAPRFVFSIPMGLRLSAQGCEERATLGKGKQEFHNPEWVASGSRVGKATTLSGLRRFMTVTPGRLSLNRANLGLNDGILSGFKKVPHTMATFLPSVCLSASSACSC
jgi:hypothetical protein